VRLVAFVGLGIACACLAAGKIGTSGQAAGTQAVTVIDATVATISSLQDPQGLALNGDGSMLYVAEGTRTVTRGGGGECTYAQSAAARAGVGIVDTATRTRIAGIEQPGVIHAEVNPADGRVYVVGRSVDAYQGTSRVATTLIDGGAPHDIGIDPTNNRGVVTNTFEVSPDAAKHTWVSLVDLATRRVLNSANTNGFGPHKAAADPTRHLVYVSHAGPPNVDVVSTETGQVLRQLATGLDQAGAQNAIDVSRRRLYVTSSGASPGPTPITLVAIDLDSELPLGRIALPHTRGLRVDPSTGLVWVALLELGQVAVVDPETLKERVRMPVGGCPFHIDIDPRRRLAYVTNEAGNSVSVLDMTKVPGAGAGPRCVVPRLKGKTLTAAKAALKSAGCATGSIRRARSRTVPKGRVISQRPAAGARLAAGAKVNLVVSRGR
jgi:DNA-binding beta-propeller fold protein YncE